MTTPFIAVATTLTLSIALASAQPTPSPALLVLSKADKTLAIVDPFTLKVVARMPSGPDPHEVEVSSDGKLAYISNYGFGSYNTITVVDLVAQKTLRAIDLGAMRGPHGLDYAGGKVYFTAEANKAIGSYDPASDRIDWIMGTGQDRTHMVKVWPNLKRIATTNVASGTVSILDSDLANRGAQGWIETVIPVGRGSEGFDVSPDQKELWTAAAQDGTVVVIDLAAKKVAAIVDAGVRGANRLKFTPDGRLALVSCLSGRDVTVLDAATRKVVKRIAIGSGTAGIQMDPSGSRAFVASTQGSFVAVIDLKTLAVSSRLDAGREPDGMAWAVR